MIAVIFDKDFQAAIKFVTVSVRLILPENGFGEFTWPLQESGVR